MGYNRSLDLMAMSLACTQAGLPVKAAAYMHEAANSVSAAAAVDAIHAANKKKKPVKKKAKAGMSVFAELGLDEEGEGEGSDDTVAALRAALEDDESEEEESSTISAKVRAARRALAEAEAEAEEEGEETASDDEADVFTMKSARRTQADATDMADLEVGEELREEVPATRSKASFARALRNIAARQK